MPRIIKQLTLFCLAVVAVFLLMEATIRYFFPQKIQSMLYETAFGIPSVIMANLDTEIINHRHYPAYHINTNSQRIRSLNNYNYTKPPNTYRILCLGDSVFFGLGANNDELFSFYLEKLFNASQNKTHYEIINASSAGWGFLQYYTFLKNEGYKYAPDLVIISTYPDDIRQNFVNHISWESLDSIEKTITLKGPKIHLGSDRPIYWIMMKLRQLPFFNKLLQYSNLLNFSRKRLNLFATSSTSSLIEDSKRLDHFLSSIDFQGYNKTNWNFERIKLKLPRFENNPIEFFSAFNKEDYLKTEANTVLYHFTINYLVDTVRNMGAEPVVVHLPAYAETFKMTTAQKIPILKNKKPPVSQLFLLEPFIQLHKNFNVPIFFSHDNHWTPAGHRLAAQIIFNFLTKKIPNLGLQPEEIIAPEMEKALLKANLRIAKTLESKPFRKFVQAMRFKNINKIDLATTTLIHYLKIRPKDYEAHFQLGLIYLIKTKYSKAKAYFLNATENGNNLEKHKYRYFYTYASKFEKAWPFIQKGDFEQALPYLEAISEIKGAFQKEANNMLALHYLKKGDMKMASFYKSKNKGGKNFQDALIQKLGIASRN